jgi:DNA-binding XRE family transcriptional regulator
MPLNPQKIKALRDALGLTQAQAARLAGMHQQAWARLEAGGRPDPKLSTAERVARVLGVGLAEIMN